MPIAFVSWSSLLNNFVVEAANFSGADIGLLHSVREIPGLLSFTLVWMLILFRQQTFALVSIFLLGAGVGATGYFTDLTGMLFVTFVMSVGFHYLEPLKDSLTMQWTAKENSPIIFGKLQSIKSIFIFGSLIVSYVLIRYLDYKEVFLIMGGVVCVVTLVAFMKFKHFESHTNQHSKIVLRKEYWLFYILTFLGGARRQIFVVFAGFLLVQKFGMNVEDMIIFLLISSSITSYIAPKIGKAIKRFGEKRVLQIEYILLMAIFTSYAFVDSLYLAMFLYVADHLVFSLSFALKTYFHKIARPEDISSTTSVSFTINHIAAVFLPVVLGLIWVGSSSTVFLIGTGIAFTSLLFSSIIKLPR